MTNHEGGFPVGANVTSKENIGLSKSKEVCFQRNYSLIQLINNQAHLNNDINSFGSNFFHRSDI